jgi:hypothetical protein
MGYFFELYREGNILMTIKHWYILSFAWKWSKSSTVNVCALPDFETYKTDRENDRELVFKLWEIINTADIVVAHNGVAFDTKKVGARFLFHGFPPPRPFFEVDTKLVAKRYFRFDSNKLNDIADYLKVGQKEKHLGFAMWKGCMEGDPKCWSDMKKYNKKDVVLLEKIYLAMRPYIRNHPNIGLMKGFSQACPVCGGINIVDSGVGYTRVNETERVRCKDCGAWSMRTKTGKNGKLKQVR